MLALGLHHRAALAALELHQHLHRLFTRGHALNGVASCGTRHTDKQADHVALGAGAAARGARTLVIDLDPQANSTRYLLGNAADGLENTAAGFFDQMLNFFKFKLDGYE